jgi:Ser/Thr protein kinase RdoA (MazF antagonist)
MKTQSYSITQSAGADPPPFVRTAAGMYGLGTAVIGNEQSGYRNRSFKLSGPEAEFNLIVYKREPGILRKIQAANVTGECAAAAGLPARTLADGRILAIRGPSGNSYAGLYNYLPGQTIPWEAYTRGHIKLLGASLSDLHDALRDCSLARLPDVIDEYETLLGRMHRYFTDPGVAGALQAKLNIEVAAAPLARAVKTLQAGRGLRRQALHMDFVRSNVLFADSTNGGPLSLSGILDFEKAAAGPPAFDIARTLAFLLVDCKYKTPLQVRQNFMVSGYARRGGAVLERRWIPYIDALVPVFLLHDLYKFLRHNPFEFLPSNEHFVRTRRLLEKHNVIQMAQP